VRGSLDARLGRQVRTDMLQRERPGGAERLVNVCHTVMVALDAKVLTKEANHCASRANFNEKRTYNVFFFC
jgi:hypothetical protein